MLAGAKKIIIIIIIIIIIHIHIQATTISAGAAAEKASDNKRVKYNDLANTRIFVPIAVETSGAWCSQSAQFVEDLGRRITAITNEPLEITYLYQRLSVSLQRGNAVAFTTLSQRHNCFHHTC